MGRRTTALPVAPTPEASIQTEAPQIMVSRRHEIDPTAELSERFDDGRSGARDAAADAAAPGRGRAPQRHRECRGHRARVDHGRRRRRRAWPPANPPAPRYPGRQDRPLCDADQSHLDRELKAAGDNGGKVAAYHDPREVFDDKTSTQWSSPAEPLARAGDGLGLPGGQGRVRREAVRVQHVGGRQTVAAARKYGRMVQTGSQGRSSAALRRVFDRLRGGELGAIRYVHALVYRDRDGNESVDAPRRRRATVDYDLWCGPSPKGPIIRKQLHYEWHWFWDTGNGEIGNNGIHVIDVGRWALGQDETPRTP